MRRRFHSGQVECNAANGESMERSGCAEAPERLVQRACSTVSCAVRLATVGATMNEAKAEAASTRSACEPQYKTLTYVLVGDCCSIASLAAYFAMAFAISIAFAEATYDASGGVGSCPPEPRAVSFFGYFWGSCMIFAVVSRLFNPSAATRFIVAGSVPIIVLLCLQT